MSYAPVTSIRIPPDPADTGLSLTVEEDTGARLPSSPFEALIWPQQQRPVIGTNACKISVTLVDGDTVTFTREDPSIPITAAMQIAVLHAQPVYSLGNPVTISEQLATADGPYTYAIQSPSGALGGFGTANGVVDGAGASHFEFVPDRAGQWRWKVFGQASTGPDHQLFVRFSDTVS